METAAAEERPTIYKYVLKEELDHKAYTQYRSYWLYRVKLSVLTDRWSEAMEHALRAVQAEPAPLSEMPPKELYKHSHPPKPMREWRILTRTVEGTLKQLRDKIHQTEALLWGDRSMGTKEAFGEQAREALARFQGQLRVACEDSLKILENIQHPDLEGQCAIQRLRGDVCRYLQMAPEAEKHYATGIKAGQLNYSTSCCHMGMHALGKTAGEPPAPGKAPAVVHLPYLPVHLSRLYGGQAESKVHINFDDSELRPAPLSAI